MPSTTNYLSFEEFEELCDMRQVNCLATSFIRKSNLKYQLEIRLGSTKMDATKEIGESYLSKVDDLQEYLGYDRASLRRIPLEAIERSTAHEFRLVYGFQKKTIPVKLGDMDFEREVDDYHVVIGVRDATGKVRWYHKFGVSLEPPREVTSEDWDEIRSKYPDCPTHAVFEFYEPEC